MRELTGYKAIILKYLKDLRDSNPDGGWVSEYNLEKSNTKFGWIGNSGGRRCREMVMDGLLERRRIGKYAEFRYNLDQPPQNPSPSANEKAEAILKDANKLAAYCQ